MIFTFCVLDRLSVESRKTKTKVITLANHSRRGKQRNEPIRTRSKYMKRASSAGKHVTDVKCGKTRANKSRLVLILLLIG